MEGSDWLIAVLRVVLKLFSRGSRELGFQSKLDLPNTDGL